jgi:hypothetical protein
MKYKWATCVWTKNGQLTVYCKDRSQAENNVTNITSELGRTTPSRKYVSVNNISNTPNFILLSEIIAAYVVDFTVLKEIHKEELMIHKVLERDIEYQINDLGDDTNKDDYPPQTNNPPSKWDQEDII